MSTTKIREALREARIYIGDRSAGSAPFWDALVGAESELDALAIAKADTRTALRDTFAAAALTLIPYDPRDSDNSRAVRAYNQADAMLAAREGK